jgi:hypothetical protein
MRVVIVSDTHVPSRAPDLPSWVRDALAEADHVVHAGDFDTVAAYRTVSDLADGNLTAVRGNVDPRELDLPSVATVAAEGVEFVVTHGDGPATTYRQRLADRVRAHGGPDAIGVAGHTHEYMDEVHDGVRLLNPGSATGANLGDAQSLLVADIADGDLEVRRRTG